MNFREKYPAGEYPISDAICSFWDAHPDVYNSLKLSNANKFEFLKTIFTSHTPPSHHRSNDQVIGFWYLDFSGVLCQFHKRICWFKQDFIVNLNEKHKEFVSYSAKIENGKYIRPISEFFNLYGSSGKFYHDGKEWQHHYFNIEGLPDEPNLKKLAQQALNRKNINIL